MYLVMYEKNIKNPKKDTPSINYKVFIIEILSRLSN